MVLFRGATATAATFSVAVLAGLLAAVLYPGTTCAAEPPTFTGESRRHSNNGAVLLETDLEPGAHLVVQMARDPTFARPMRAYDGQLPSAYVSGLDDGTYHFRARRGEDGEWSRTVRLDVAHHAMARVWPVLSVGCLAFLGTLLVLVHGAVRSRRTRTKP